MGVGKRTAAEGVVGMVRVRAADAAAGAMALGWWEVAVWVAVGWVPESWEGK